MSTSDLVSTRSPGLIRMTSGLLAFFVTGSGLKGTSYPPFLLSLPQPARVLITLLAGHARWTCPLWSYDCVVAAVPEPPSVLAANRVRLDLAAVATCARRPARQSNVPLPSRGCSRCFLCCLCTATSLTLSCGRPQLRYPSVFSTHGC